MPRITELALVFLASLAPMFLLATRIDADEFAKAGASSVLAACAVAVSTCYRTWRGVS